MEPNFIDFYYKSTNLLIFISFLTSTELIGISSRALWLVLGRWEVIFLIVAASGVLRSSFCKHNTIPFNAGVGLGRAVRWHAEG
jgi:hypothetical protein